MSNVFLVTTKFVCPPNDLPAAAARYQERLLQARSHVAISYFSAEPDLVSSPTELADFAHQLRIERPDDNAADYQLYRFVCLVHPTSQGVPDSAYQCLLMDDDSTERDDFPSSVESLELTC